MQILSFDHELLPCMFIIHLGLMLNHISIDWQLRLLYQPLVVISIPKVVHPPLVHYHCHVEKHYCLNDKSDHGYGRGGIKVWQNGYIVVRCLTIHDNAEVAQEECVKRVHEKHARVE